MQSSPNDPDQQQEIEKALSESTRKNERTAGQTVLDKLANAKPSWMREGGLTPPALFAKAETTSPRPSRVDRTTPQPAFPALVPVAEQVTEQVAGGAGINVSFAFSDASTTEDDVTSNKILITDGKVQGTYVDGMGFGGYELDLDNPEEANIVVIVTYDEETLEITSRTIGEFTNADYPENEPGTFNILIGYTWFDGDDVFRFQNSLVGDISFELIYGAQSGTPALFMLYSYSPPIEIPEE